MISIVEALIHPCNTLFHKPPHVGHLGLITAPYSRILVNDGIHDVPTHEVELLRLFQFLFHIINPSHHILFRQSCLTSLIPYLYHLFSCCSIPNHNVIHKAAHIASTTASTPIDVIALAVDGICSVVILERQVKVPNRTCIEFVVTALLIHENTPISIGIS